MAVEIFVAVAALVAGLGLLAFSSDRAVRHTLQIASALGLPPMFTGLVLVSVGTDLPEIATSLISSAVGHGDILVGDAFGSCLAQITLVLGILAIAAKKIEFDRRDILFSGSLQVLALVIAVSMAEKGHISTLNAALLILSWAMIVLVMRRVHTSRGVQSSSDRRYGYHFVLALISYIGVWIGSFVVVESIIFISSALQLSELILSFFAVAVGTSLPELAVDLAAIRRGEHELALGDIIGSNIVDATLAVGIGPLFFPITVSGGPALATGLYAILASAAALGLLLLKGEADRNTGILLVLIYLFSYIWTPAWVAMLT